jgi:3-phosphoshikimate 1-carboxyvinyltransferase
VVERGADRIDLRDAPDLFQPLAALFAGAERQMTFTGLSNLAHKETDRLRAMGGALSAFGVKVDRNDEQFWISPTRGGWREPPTLDPQGDHRMAMALAPLALVSGTIGIKDPDVVNKSYPGYWKDLEKAGFIVEHVRG